MAMVMVNAGHIALAISAYQTEYYLAWGTARSDTDISKWRAENTPPAEDPATTDLLLEVGRRIVTDKAYVKEDKENGTVEANNTKWARSATPTNHFYLMFKFEAKDAPTAVLRQVGLFTGTQKKASVPATKYFLLPEDLENKGALFMYQNIAPIVRNTATREVFEYVITF